MTGRLDLEAIRESNPLPTVVGGVVELKRAGREWKACCPFHSEQTPSFTIYSNGRRFMCFGCGAEGDVFDFVSRIEGIGLRDAALRLGQGEVVTTNIAPLPPANDEGDRTEEARSIWRNAVPATGTPVEAYLRWRGISIPIPETIRFARLQYGKRGREYPCLVAVVTGPDNRLCGIQRTYLADDGRGKADVPKPKLSLGRVRCGAIRLAPVSRHLTVCEGLEDGLSLQEAIGGPVWVACGASNLPSMRLPDFVRDVAIGGDNDASGRAAAENAARTMSARGHGVRVFYPSPPHKDFNEELKESRG
ncbi:virulence-associated protein E [Altererythrobacter aurantiacus]|uniref:Virulence-associated protein E n=1 Tax=Parapontixanthobacter aurantiacus TaxID=1463599 RepID=A0A844ZD87_9SPHN|nr:CHC2 zinc finger domain-containing protein [Parapontixanthobacter aurantiacus]MXO85232.1 virulence-associated protein E [Parapontixanthobacter aurantiacus]